MSKLPLSPKLPKSFAHGSEVFSAAALAVATSVHSHALQSWACSGGNQQATCDLAITPAISSQTQVANILEESDSFKLKGTVNVVSQGFTLPLQESDLVVVSGSATELYGTAVLPLDNMLSFSAAVRLLLAGAKTLNLRPISFTESLVKLLNVSVKAGQKAF